MSGFVVLLARHGAAVDRAQLERLAQGLAFRGPDSTHTLVRGPAGFGVSLLHASMHRSPADSVRQALVDDGDMALVGDVRLDDRDRVRRDLEGAGVAARPDATDAELWLAAYRTWGSSCVTHLSGDFAVVVWDEPRQRLLLARDQFGVAPLYYAQAGGDLVVSNTLDAIRAHPGVSAELDDGAVGDFLRVGYNTDLASTVFRQVRCVPPAHVAGVRDGVVHVERYWELPVEEPVAFGSIAECAAAFNEVLHPAVRDRLRDTDAAALLLSGGRDSTAVAATARDVVPAGTLPALRAFTIHYDYAVPDEERAFASAAAAHLGIPAEFVAADEYALFGGRTRTDCWRPAPVEDAQLAADADFMARVARHARVALDGHGGDAALRESESRLARLLLGGHWWRALREATTYTMLHHRLPRPGFRRLRARRAQALPLLNPIPQWMRPEFIRAARLEERWRAVERAAERDAQHHPWRPEAYGKLVSWFWPRMFEEMDPGFTGVPVHVRHPLMDLRVVRFLLRVPPAQWYNDKGILVAAMKGRLPDRVRFRNKTPLVGDANAVALAAGGVPATELQRVSPRIEPYVDPAGFGTTPSSPDSDDSWDWLRAVSLSEWLARVERGDSFVRAGGEPGM